MTRTEAQKRAQAKYQKKRNKKSVTKSYCFTFHHEHDQDIIERLQSQENKSGYVKRLIREDIKKQG